MSIIINGMNMPKGNSTKNLLIYGDGKVFTGHKDDANYSAEERETGKWLEKEVIHADEAKKAIEEWQSCKCSVCGRYDTRPYLYYFSEPKFCSWCGAFNGKTKEGEENA